MPWFAIVHTMSTAILQALNPTKISKEPQQFSGGYKDLLLNYMFSNSYWPSVENLKVISLSAKLIHQIWFGSIQRFIYKLTVVQSPALSLQALCKRPKGTWSWVPTTIFNTQITAVSKPCALSFPAIPRMWNPQNMHA